MEKRCRVVSILLGTKNQNERQLMRKHLLKVTVFCAACSMLAAQAQTEGGTATPGSPGSSSKYGSSQISTNSSDTSSSGKSSWNEKSALSATGRVAHQELRGSQLIGVPVQSSTGVTIGTITDYIVNPIGGRIDFAIISLSSSTGAAGGSSAAGGTSTGTSSRTGSSSSLSTTAGTSSGLSSSSSLSGKQVAVPWQLLRPAMNASSSSSSSSTSGLSAGASSMGQPAFVCNGDITN